MAQSAKPVRITNVDIFSIEIPTKGTALEERARGKPRRTSVIRLETDVGVHGHSFAGVRADLLDKIFRPMLVGKDLFAIDDLLKQSGRGLSIGPVGGGLAISNLASVRFGAVEHAVWDAIGKIANQPVHRLLGGYRSKSSIKVYVTTVWPGKSDQTHVSYKQQADWALKLKRAGYKGMKLRSWRPNPMDDVDACGEIRAAVGPDFAIMWDRTADWAGWVWDYETALKVCRGMEKYLGNEDDWMEEPFSRVDLLSARRLRREARILITGGNGIVGLDDAREFLMADAFDILQPDGVTSGGILTNVKIGILCEAFHTPVTLHGTGADLSLAGWLQASAAIGTPWQEIAVGFGSSPLLPEEGWSHLSKLVKRPEVFVVREGEIQVPTSPGLGLELNEDALEHYRARARLT
jgi:D-galactarolactone cycloisomerase